MSRRGRGAAHRRFDAWRAVHAARFPLALHATRDSDGEPCYAFVGCTDALSLQISDSGLGVAVTWQGELIDYVLDLDVAPSRQDGGYICLLCEPPSRTVFASLDALWTDHAFEPLLTWMHETLMPARLLGIWIARGRFTTARLFRDEAAFRLDFGGNGFALPVHETG